MSTERFGIDKMELAVLALIRRRSIKRAASEVGVHPVTLWRWLKLPHFREQLRQAQAQLYSQAVARLQQAASTAAEVLLAMLNDRNTPPASRIRIAELVLEQSKAGFAIEELDFAMTEPESSQPATMHPASSDIPEAFDLADRLDYTAPLTDPNEGYSSSTEEPKSLDDRGTSARIKRRKPAQRSRTPERTLNGGEDLSRTQSR